MISDDRMFARLDRPVQKLFDTVGRPFPEIERRQDERAWLLQGDWSRSVDKDEFTAWAAYSGVELLINCDEEILPGHLATYADDGVIVHVVCPDDRDMFNGGASRPVCPRCFMVVPVTGSCDCDD